MLRPVSGVRNSWAMSAVTRRSAYRLLCNASAIASTERASVAVLPVSTAACTSPGKSGLSSRAFVEEASKAGLEPAFLEDYLG